MEPSYAPTRTQRLLALVQSPWAISLCLVLASVLVYHRTFASPFVFDDGLAVRENSSIRALADWRAVLSPPNNASGVSGRPIVNLSLALNYALGGLDPAGYHVANVLAHGVAATLLFHCFRLLLPAAGVPGPSGAAFLIALLWVVHPLQSESVASVIQRTEILVAIFFLGTLLCLAAAAASGRRRLWEWLGFVCCLTGMATKEIMVVAPIMILLVDRALLAGSFAEAWRCRWRFHVSLFATWLILAFLLYRMGGSRGEAAGFGAGPVTWWQYFLKQWEAIVHYLRLVAWPHPLVIDYGCDVVSDPGRVLAQGLALTAAGSATCWGLYRNRPWALLGAWFFLILGPSSSVMPLAAQTMAEHRMYLPLVAPLALVVITARRAFGSRGSLVLGTISLAFAGLSFARTTDYSSELRLWTETVAHRPRNERAYHNLALILDNAGRHQEAQAYYQRAVELKPLYVLPRIGLANGHFRAGRPQAAIREYDTVLKLDPDSVAALSNLGVLLCEMGEQERGVTLLQRAVKLRSDHVDAHFNLGTVLTRAGRLDLAEISFREAVRLNPSHPEALNNLGVLLLRRGLPAEGEMCFREALRSKPDYAEARNNLRSLGKEP